MIKNEKVRVVVEDAVIGSYHGTFVKEYKEGVNEFEFPFTVSFCSEGEYKVTIKGKRATVNRICEQ